MNERPSMSIRENHRSLSEEAKGRVHDLLPVFHAIWAQQHIADRAPVALPGYTSGNNLPVSISMKYLSATEKKYLGGDEQVYRWGYVFGLFERNRLKGKQVYLPIGQMVLSESADRGITCHGASLFHNHGKDDKYFSPLVEKDDAYGISLNLNGSDHTKRGLGKLLLDAAVLTVATCQQKQLMLSDCNEKSRDLVRRSGYSYKETYDIEEHSWDYEITVPGDIKTVS